MMYWGTGMNGWGMLLMTVSTLVFWGLVIAGIVFLVRQSGPRQQPTPPPQEDPRQILSERYARGEIDDEEYHRRLGTLRGATSTGSRV